MAARGRLRRILDVNGVARLLHLHPETVRRWFREGLLPGRRVGCRWLANEEEVVRALGLDATDGNGGKG